MPSDSTNRRNPKYRQHKQSEQAIVTLPDGLGGRKDFLLGKFNSTASIKEYNRLIAWWIGNGRRLPMKADAGPSVNEVLLLYYEHCKGYYRGHDGKPSQELTNVRCALRPVKNLYGTTLASAFDCLSFKAVRQSLNDAGLSRGGVNKDRARIKRCFRWAAAEKMVPASVYHELETVEGLRYGRSDARETVPV